MSQEYSKLFKWHLLLWTLTFCCISSWNGITIFCTGVSSFSGTSDKWRYPYKQSTWERENRSEIERKKKSSPLDKNKFNLGKTLQARLAKIPFRAGRKPWKKKGREERKKEKIEGKKVNDLHYDREIPSYNLTMKKYQT